MLPGEILPTTWDSIPTVWASVLTVWACSVLTEWVWATVLMEWACECMIRFSTQVGVGDRDSILASTLALETQCITLSVAASTILSGVVTSLAQLMVLEDRLLLMAQLSSYLEAKMVAEALSTVQGLAVVPHLPMAPVL